MAKQQIPLGHAPGNYSVQLPHGCTAVGALWLNNCMHVEIDVPDPGAPLEDWEFHLDGGFDAGGARASVPVDAEFISRAVNAASGISQGVYAIAPAALAARANATTRPDHSGTPKGDIDQLVRRREDVRRRLKAVRSDKISRELNNQNARGPVPTEQHERDIKQLDSEEAALTKQIRELGGS